MRYITRRDVPSFYAVLSDVEKTIVECLETEYVTCNSPDSTDMVRSLFYLKNGIDLSAINAQYIESFDAKELSTAEALDFVEKAYPEKNVSIGEDGRFVLTNKTPEIRVIDFTNKDYQPYADAVWDEDRHVWTLPRTKLNEVNFTSTWDEDRGKWVSACNVGRGRMLRTFHLWAVKEVDGVSEFSSACSSNEYMIESIENVTHGTNTLQSMVVKKREDGVVEYPKIRKHAVVLDLAPIARVTYQEFDEEDANLFHECSKIHPQCSGRTAHELFRVIVEWAWSYTELGNTEPMAKICHDVLRAMQMPIEVRQELLELRPQYVARYISGDHGALAGYADDEDAPPLFSLWISDMYYLYECKMNTQSINVNIDALSDSYPT